MDCLPLSHQGSPSKDEEGQIRLRRHWEHRILSFQELRGQGLWYKVLWEVGGLKEKNILRDVKMNFWA